MTSVSVPTLFPLQTNCDAYSQTPATLTNCVLFGKNFACFLTSPLSALTIIGGSEETTIPVTRSSSSYQRPSVQNGSSLSTLVSPNNAFNVGSSNTVIGGSDLTAFNNSANITGTNSVVVASRGSLWSLNSNVVYLASKSFVLDTSTPANSVTIHTSTLMFPNLARYTYTPNAIYCNPRSGKLQRLMSVG